MDTTAPNTTVKDELASRIDGLETDLSVIDSDGNGIVDAAVYATSAGYSTSTGYTDPSTIDHDQLLNTHNLTTDIDHQSITGAGSYDHTDIDDFIDSKAAASGLASLNASSKVVEDPANAVYTAAAYKIPIATSTGKIDTNYIPTLTAYAVAAHTHSKLIASDGDPDPAVSVDAAGDVTLTNNLKIKDNMGIALGTDEDAVIADDGNDLYIIAKKQDKDIIFCVHDGAVSDKEVMRIDGSESQLKLLAGVGIDEFSSDLTLSGDSDTAVPTEHVVYNTVKPRWGLTTSNAADTDHDITIAVGGGMDDATTTYYIGLTAAITKRIDAAWAAGTGNGGLFSGNVGNATQYHIFIIKKDSDGTVDAGFDTSATAANKPAGYTYYKRVGWVLTDGSANILQFVQTGNYFRFKVPILNIDITTANPAAAALHTLSVPTGFIVRADINIRIFHATLVPKAYIYDPNSTAAAPSSTASPLANINCNVANTAMYANMKILTNTSSQIGSWFDTVSCTLRIATLGFEDFIGKI
jgi:hypothetical protein